LDAIAAGSVTNLLENMAEANCPKAAEPLLQKAPDEVTFLMENKLFNHEATYVITEKMDVLVLPSPKSKKISPA
jgi:hypothetical protein